MKNELINDKWKKHIEKANENDWYILPIITILSLITLTAIAGIENIFNVFSQFFSSIITNL